ncbi:MAG TPA: serine hydrolase [Thermoanaerobaculia bacterium]|nr:serine hydrolase [Thermoanaerobaculia bacterium]
MKTAMICILTAVLITPAALPADTIDLKSLRKAAEYSAARKGISMLVMVDGEILFEDYPNGGSPSRPSELASGTKSFSGAMAVAAAQDGLLKLDERVSRTITEWQREPRRSKITIRQLLSLTSGIEAASRAGRVPTYAAAVTTPVATAPGARFDYGAEPFQIFGELMLRKLASRGEDPLDYLKRRIFDPIGLEIGRWRRGADGNPHLPSGASLTARDWAKFGELVRRGGVWQGRRILDKALLDQCFQGTPANPAYGLTWWLNRNVPPALRRTIPLLQRNGLGNADLWAARGIPRDLVMAAGAGDQRLYISRERKLVVVRQADGILGALFGADSGYSDLEFLTLLLAE